MVGQHGLVIRAFSDEYRWLHLVFNIWKHLNKKVDLILDRNEIRGTETKEQS
jgi:hypothetical protein|tara:strand:+ start:413 stop:568 length:156 start_codon:yes stop_codon:yes gene_type:complete